MDVLMWRVLILCQPFLRRETKKLIDVATFCLICSSVMLTFPTLVPIQRTFLRANLTVCLCSLTFSMMLSFSPMVSGYLPILTKMLPSSFGINFIRDSLASKISYGLAHFLISFLSLLNFFKPS